MSQHQHITFTCGQILGAYAKYDPDGAAAFLADVSQLDRAGVLRGMEDAKLHPRRTERADDMRTFRELVRTR